jgi:tetratricopeptide (TPR) repeat protein
MRFKLALLLCVIAVFVSVTAQPQQRDIKKEQPIWDQLGKIDPSAVEDFKQATIALDSEKFDECARLYEAVLRKAPDFDPATRRLGYCFVGQGKYSEGVDLAKLAVERDRSADNLLGLAFILANPGKGKQNDRATKAEALALAQEAARVTTDKDDPAYVLLIAQLSLELEQIDVFRSATQKLVTTHPELMATHYFNAILAAYDENWMTAESEIKLAEKLGLPHQVAQEFLDSGVQTRANVWHYAIYAGALIVAWLVGLLLLFLLGKFLSWRTLKSIETADPNAQASSAELSLRRWYRRLINIGGVYYFISMPVVMFLVLAFAAGVTYGFMMLGRIPIKLVAILVIGAILTVYKMVRSLFLKIEKEDPGRALAKEEAPELWELTRKVAEVVKTRPIDEIRITPGTELAVYERGTMRERGKDQAKRILIVGVGTLNDFHVNAFRAVLAHEYGHFSHRDTAGGDVALRVNDHMMKFAYAMALSGQAVWWNIAFQFLRVYHFIFRRISHGATRLQEVLADRIAASRYGAQAFEEGLTHVIRKSVEFEHLATKEINGASSASRALQNLYELTLAVATNLEAEMDKELNRETTEDDTHPCPNDRFRFTRRIVSQTEPSTRGLVWDLFKDRAGITAEMTALIQQRLR